MKGLRRMILEVQVEEQRPGDEGMEGPSCRSEIKECSQVTCRDHMDSASATPSVVSSRIRNALVNHISSHFPSVVPSGIFIPQMLVIREYLI